MTRRPYWFERLDPAERARYFRHTTPEQLLAYVGEVRCDDPVTLARVAALVLTPSDDEGRSCD